MSNLRSLSTAVALTASLLPQGPAAAATSRTAVVVAEVTAANAAVPSAERAEKYALMKASAHAFLRGSNHLFWRDLARSPLLAIYGGMSATRTFLAGDQHLANFGIFDDDQGDVVFALNDFDQAVVGDYQLDLWRAAVSLVLVARDNGLSSSTQASALDAFTESYLDAMASYAEDGAESSTKHTAAEAYGVLDERLREVAAEQSRSTMLSEWTVVVSGVRRFDFANPDLAAVSSTVDSDVRARLTGYRGTLSGGGAALPASFFAVKSVAQRLHAGLGSLGSRRYYVLIEGATTSNSDDRILDLKEQTAPAGLAYLDSAAVTQTQDVCGGDHALRAVLAQKALGYRVDDLLGYLGLGDGKRYSVRERSPFKADLDTAELSTSTRLTNLAEQWGLVLATHHARADRDWDASIFPGSLDGAIHARTDGDHSGVRALVRSVALDYADQVALDWASFRSAF